MSQKDNRLHEFYCALVENEELCHDQGQLSCGRDEPCGLACCHRYSSYWGDERLNLYNIFGLSSEECDVHKGKARVAIAHFDTGDEKKRILIAQEEERLAKNLHRFFLTLRPDKGDVSRESVNVTMRIIADHNERVKYLLEQVDSNTLEKITGSRATPMQW